MARVVYVEAEEEITDLVERIRDLHDESEIVFVMPNRSRVLQSLLNLRLLQQYARSFMKSASVVSADARTQQLARETGFPTYASVAAYERGVEAVPASGAVTAGVGVAGPAAIGAAAAALLPEDAPEEVDDRALDAAPAAAPRPAPPVARPRLSRTALAAADRRRGLFIAAAAIFLIGILLLFLVAPTAKVTIVLQATPVKEDGLTIQGTPDQNAAAGPDKVLTVVSTADAGGPFDFKATGHKDVPAVAAQSAVQFSTDYAAPFCLRITKGSALAQSGSTRWLATDTPAYDAQCGGNGVYVPGSSNGQFAAPSKAIAVTASSTGAAGNVAAGVINQVDPGINGCNPANYPPGGPIAPPNCAPKDFAVANPSAATGGVDAKSLTIVSDADLAAFKQALDQKTADLTATAKQTMQQKTPGKVFAIDPAKSGLTIATEVSPPMPNSGDQAPGDQQITVTVHAKAAMYDPNDVRSRLEDKLRSDVRQVQSGAVLDDKSKVIGDPTVQQAGDDGVVVFSISGSGYATPAVDTEKLKDGFTGKSRDAVRKAVSDQYGSAVQDVQISQSIPFFVLPFFVGRIEVSLCVRSPNQAC